MSISGKNKSKRFNDSRIDKLVGELKVMVVNEGLWWNDICYKPFGDRADEIKDYMIEFCRIQSGIKKQEERWFF